MSKPAPSTSEKQRVALPRRSEREVPAWLRGIYAGICVYLCLAALGVMGSGLGTFGDASDFLSTLFAYGENPFIALLSGSMGTVIVQISSVTATFIVAV